MYKSDAIAALEAGDIGLLLALKRDLYGGAVMSVAPQDGTETPDGDVADGAAEGDEDETEDVESEHVKKLNAENKRWRERFQAERNRAKALEDEAAKGASAEDKLSRAEQRAIEAEARAARREVALEHGLTPADAKFLDGLTDEDLMADLAARLALPVRKTKADDGDETDDRSTRRVGIKGSTNGRRGGSGGASKDDLGRAFFGV